MSYEASPGLMRRFLKKGASFRSLGGGESSNDSSSSFGRFGNSEKKKWRPRKNQFELLDGDDDESLSAAFNEEDSFSWNIQPVVSASESDLGECRRGIMFEQKATPLKKSPVKSIKRGLSPLKPPCNDTSAIRGPSSSTMKPPQKIQRNDIEWSASLQQDDLRIIQSNGTSTTADETMFNSSTDSFGFQIPEKNTISSHIEQSSKSQKVFPLSSHNSVVSDPTDFFSKEQASKLTSGNLAKMDSAPNTTTSAATGMEKLVKERKFYQFAVDEDKTSTVIESTIQLPADYPCGDYSIDDATEISCGETSQGTRIQPRSVASQRKLKQTESNDLLPSSSHSRKHANEVKEFDAFFPNDAAIEKGAEKKFDEFFPTKSMDNDGFFPEYGGAKESQNATPPTPGTDLSSFGGDYFDPRHNSSNTVGQASSKSLAYSVSPVNQHMRSPSFVRQNIRQPLSSKNSRLSSGRKSNEWFAPKTGREHEAQFEFDSFPAPPSASKKKRHSSIGSSNFQAPPADPFESPSRKYGAKENFSESGNRQRPVSGGWGMNQNKQHRQSFERPLQKNAYDDIDSDEDDDIFDEVGNWERPKPTSIGNGVQVQNRTFAINRARISRYSNESYNRPSRNRYIDDDYDDDARSVASGFEIAKKPMGLPSNAIMASMLFQTQQYDIDQNDVAAKIDAIERENSRHRKVRTSQGGIPDAVNTDDDYMTTVSSFSDATSAYLQEAWRKPSTDLMNHFTSARALDMEYRRLPVRTQRVEPKPQRVLYEA